MCSSKVAFALLASIALASAVPSLGNTGLGGILGGNNGNGGGVGGIIGGGQGGLGGVTGGEGGLGGVLGGILGGLGDVGTILEGILGSETGLGGLLGALGNPDLAGLLEPVLGSILQLVQNLLQSIQEVLASLAPTLEGIINAITSSDSLEQQTQALQALRTQNPVPFDTIFYIVSQLDKTGGNGEVVPSLPTVPVPAPTPATPQIPV